MTNDENWEKNKPIISKYGPQIWKNGKRTPDHLVSVMHNGISLNDMLNEARADERKEVFKELDALFIPVPMTDAEMDKLTTGAGEEMFRVLKLKDYMALKKKRGIE